MEKKLIPLLIKIVQNDILHAKWLNTLSYLETRFLIKECSLDTSSLKKTAYLLVTYAIEVRAQKFYPIYETVLRDHRSKVHVKSIILEEEEHLEEMQEGIKKLALGERYAAQACLLEQTLFNKWIYSIETDLANHQILGAQMVH